MIEYHKQSLFWEMKIVTLQKRFENYWYYYKWHTIVGIAVIMLIILGLKSFSSSKEADMTIVYVSDKYADPSVSQNFQDSLKENNLTADLNGDKTEYFYLDPMVVSFDGKNQDVAIMQKLQVYMAAGSQSLMMVHKYILEDYDGAFEDISDLCQDDENAFVSKDKTITGISVEGNKYLESLGINTDNLYLCLKQRTQKELKNKNRDKEYELAGKIIKFILSQQ